MHACVLRACNSMAGRDPPHGPVHLNIVFFDLIPNRGLLVALAEPKREFNPKPYIFSPLNINFKPPKHIAKP